MKYNFEYIEQIFLNAGVDTEDQKKVIEEIVKKLEGE